VAQEALNALIELPIIKNFVRDHMHDMGWQWAVGEKALDVESRAATLLRLLEMQTGIEAQVGPQLLKFASAGLRDFLGVDISADQLGLRGGTAGRGAAADSIGKHVIGSMFGTFRQGGGITPEVGLENAENLISAVIGTALEGWLGTTLGFGYITKDLPNWGDLDDVVARNLGMGRVTSRVLRPLIDALVLEPFTQYLNDKLRPALLTEAQATRAVNRGTIDEEAYFEIMGRHGWPRGIAAELRMQHTQQLSRSELQQLYDQRLLQADDVLMHLRAQGYSQGLAEGVFRLIQNDRVSSLRTALATTARDMFRDRDIDEDQARDVLRSIDYSEAEIAALLAVARVERARRRRLTNAQAEEAFRFELLDADALRGHYEREGYSPRDVEVLLSLAVKDKEAADQRAADKKLGRPPRLTDDDYVEFYRRGLIDTAALRAALAGLRLEGQQLELVLARAVQLRAALLDAQRRKVVAAAGVRVKRATFEEAFIRGLIDEGQLARELTAAGFDLADVDLLLQLRREERADFLRRMAGGSSA
jgi:hypothetical protein